MNREIEAYLAPFANRLEAFGHPIGAETVRNALELIRMHPDIPSEVPGDTIYHHPLFDYDFASGRIINNGNISTFNEIENVLFKMYSIKPNSVIKHESVCGVLFGYTEEGDSVHYRAHIKNIGQKFREIGVDPRSVIKSVPSVGYYLKDISLLKNVVEGPTEDQIPIVYNHPDFKFYPRTFSVLFPDGIDVDFTPLENAFLEKLMSNPNRFIRNEELCKIACETLNVEFVSPEYIKTHISHIRKKLGNGSLIKGLKRVGYRFVENPTEKKK